MSLPGIDRWLQIPPDRDVIARWTAGDGNPRAHALALPPPPAPDRFEFLVLGDTGDSEASGPGISPQDAVAQCLAADAALPGRTGEARMVLHTGDVIYMAGERRLYDRNFRRPYASFLTPESTAERMVFRLPFLPVPGNHDYYDLGRWGIALSRLPVLGAGLRAIAHELFAFSLPEGGSEMGKAYMQAFVEAPAESCGSAVSYRPGEYTRLPNRYYRFRLGAVDFFALDSNTLDAPSPSTPVAQVRGEASERIPLLERRAQSIDRQLRRDELALERWRAEQRQRIAASPPLLAALTAPVAAVAGAMATLDRALSGVPAPEHGSAADATAAAARRWAEAAADLAAESHVAAVAALHALEEASDECCAALRAVEGCLIVLPEGPVRSELMAAEERLKASLAVWSTAHHADPLPQPLCDRLRKLAEEALDVQQELARERRRTRYRPEDHDTAQLEWLRTGLAESARENADGWRVVYLHHPLYSTIVNHCEHPEVQGVRENLLSLLRDRVHLVLAGHSHAFEWIRADRLPGAGLFVTGGGGQVTLRRSLLEPSLLHRHRDRYDRLREAGAVECAVGGRGPAASDGEAGPLYHYLRVEVTPESLVVHPVGVRRLAAGYRRETPMPVFHAPELPEARPPWRARRLEGVEIRRGQPPRARWG